jgi:glutamate-1-semialdehyde 2,1-aminomutase
MCGWRPIVLGHHHPKVEAAEATRGDLAAIVVAAFRHDVARDQEMPRKDFAQRARAICDAADAALIVDDVRAGFRLHASGSWELIGARPDLSAWSKAIANGYALAAVTGKDRFREAATRSSRPARSGACCGGTMPSPI